MYENVSWQFLRKNAHMNRLHRKAVKNGITMMMAVILILQNSNVVFATEKEDIELLQEQSESEVFETTNDIEDLQNEQVPEDKKNTEEWITTDAEEQHPEQEAGNQEESLSEKTPEITGEEFSPENQENKILEEQGGESTEEEGGRTDQVLDNQDGESSDENTEKIGNTINEDWTMPEDVHQEVMLMQLEDENPNMEIKDEIKPLERTYISDGIYSISSVQNEDYRISVENSSMENGANILLSQNTDTDAQRFYIHHLGGNSYIFISVASGKVIEVESEKKQDGINVRQGSYDNLITQKWWISCDDNGYYTFVSEASGKVMDVTNGMAKEGANLQQYTWNGTDAQRFILSKCGKQLLAEGEYVLQTALADNKVLDVNGAGTENGANVQIYEMNGTMAQTFQVKYNEDGTYTFVAKHSGKALDVSGGSWENGANIQQYQENGSAAQKWLLKDTGGGYYMLFSALSGKALDIDCGKIDNGSNVQIYEGNGSAAQKIIFQTGPTRIADGVYSIVSGLNNGKVVDICNADYKNGTNAQLYSCNDTDAQKFYFHNVGNMNYILISCASGKVLEVQNENYYDGANVCQNTYNGSAYQRWILRNKENGYYEIVSAATGKVLDVSGGKDKDGSNIQQYASNDSKAQRFLLKPQNEKKIPEGIFSFRPSSSYNKVIDISGASVQNGANVQIYEINGSMAQNFQIKYNNDGTYTFSAVHSSKVLDINGNNWKNGTNVQQYENNGTSAQKWLIHGVGNGKYIFISASNGKVLEIADGRDANGSNVQIYEYNGFTSQQFCIQKSKVTISEGIYSLHSELNNNQVLDVSGGNISERANVQLYSFNNTDAQKFYIHDIGGTNYILISLVSGRVLTVENEGMRDGENISLCAYQNSAYQKWWLIQDENGKYSFVSAATGKVLDVAGGNSKNGSNIQQYTINGSDAQKFILKNAAQKSVQEDTYVVKSGLASNKVLDVVGAASKDGTNVQLYQSNGTAAQRFQLKYNNDGTYTLLAEHSKKALDVSGGNYSNGTNVQQYSQNGSAAQKWLIKNVGGGRYALFSASSGKALDICGANSANGANAQIYEYNGSKAQIFSFSPPDIMDMPKLQVLSCEGSDCTKNNIRIALNVEKNSSIQYFDYEWYIVLMDSMGKKVIDAQKADIKLSSILTANAVFKSSDAFKTIVMGRFALAFKSSTGYCLVSDSMFLSNPNAVKLTDEDIKDRYYGYYEGYKITSKKGIQGVSSAYTEDLGVQHVLLNVDLADMVSTVPKAGYISYVYKGQTYYFQDLIALKKTVYDLHGWGSTEGNAYGLNHMRSVTFNLLLSWDDSLTYLIHPSARLKGAAPYYALNMAEEKARNTFEALFCYMGEEFGTEYKERVSNWTLGNEINSCNMWNYSGSMSLDEYVSNYAQAFQLLSQGVHRSVSSSRVFISLDHCWNVADAGFTGKEFLDKFALYMYQTASFMQWNVNYHPYSQPLNRNTFWNDYFNTTDSLNTRYISMRNIQVLTDYLGTIEAKYGKQNGSIRVILGELGYSAIAGDQNKEKEQAAALGYGYYKALFNTRIDAYIIRAYLDAPEEVRDGLYLGLRDNNSSETAKLSYDVYKNLDTENSLNYMNQYLDLIGVGSWSDVISGFDASKLPAKNF